MPFDPNKPYDAAPKQGFDPSKPYQASAQPQSDIPRPGEAPDNAPKPTGILNTILTQGGRLDPSTAKEMLGQDLWAALESGAGLGPTATAAGKAAAPVVKAAGKGAAAAGEGLSEGAAHVIGGLGTHTGAESIKQAAKAGFEGGEKAEAFLGALRGNLPMKDVVEKAKDSLSNMRQARSAEYRSGMVDIKNDATLLKFDDISKTLKELPDFASYAGEITNPAAAAALAKIKDYIVKWQTSDALTFHTPEGFDALKQAIGSVREETEAGTRARALTDKAYNAVKDTIVEQAPTYAKVMKEYHDASDMLYELEKGLSLGEKSTVDTSLRKLQSVMRNNVQTNYGNRLDLVKDLEEKGGASIMPQLAGHALSSWTPRGLGGAVAPIIGAGSLYEHSLPMAATLPFQSPRLMGEASYYAGKGARSIADLARMATGGP